MEECRVFVIDDDVSVCRGLSRLLQSAGYKTEEYNSAADFLKRELFTGTGCLVLDVRMPQKSGIELQQQLNKQNSQLPVIFLTAHGDLPIGIAAMKQGADDFLTKPVDDEILLAAISRALARHRATCKEQKKLSDIQRRLDRLTPREFEVLQYILGGGTNKEIANELSISEKTVKAHRGKVMNKLNASSAAEMGWICSNIVKLKS
ncbi:MAG: response regulator transcription factor [Proteobacteria bacterium]|nr:response regulator transcription factor [Pseudomonadota bacterium]